MIRIFCKLHIGGHHLHFPAATFSAKQLIACPYASNQFNFTAKPFVAAALNPLGADGFTSEEGCKIYCTASPEQGSP